MADNIRNPRDNNRGLNSIDNYVIDQFISLQSPEELQRNLNQSKSIISNFFNNDLFAIRSQYTQKIEDLETKALLNAENARYELELKNRKEINELLTKSLADQAKGYEQILNDMQKKVNNFKSSSSSSSNNSSGIEDSAEHAGRNIADAFSRGVSSNVGQATSIGTQLGSNLIKGLTNAISTGLNSYLTAVGGKLDVIGSFTTGNQIASNFRSEFGRYSYGNTLKEQAEAITTAYSDMRDSGIIVDPNILVNMYRELGNIVSLTGTSSAKLSSLLNVTTKISESGVGLDTSTKSSDIFRNMFGEDMWEQMQGTAKYLQTQYTNLTDEALSQILNDQNFAYQTKMATINIKDRVDRQEAILKMYEDMIQNYGYIADTSSISSALGIQEIASGLMNPNRQLGEFFKSNTGYAALLNQNLTNYGVTTEQLSSSSWMAENHDVLVAAIISSASQMQSKFASGGMSSEDYEAGQLDLMRLAETLGLQDFDPNVFLDLVSNYSGNIEEVLRELQENNQSAVSLDDIASVFEAQSSGYTNADRLNQQLEIAGFSAVSATYEDQTLGWLALIGNTLLNAVGGVGGGLIGGLIQGATGGIVGGLLTGAGSAGGSAGGLIALLGPAAPWIAGAAAVLGTAYLIVDGIKQGQEESNRLMNEQIDEYTKSMGIFSSINEDTGLITMEVTKPEDIPENAVAVWNPETKTYDWVESKLSDEEKTAGMSEEEKEKIRQSEADKTAMSLYKAAASSDWAANASYKADIKNSKNGYTTLEGLYNAYKSGELTAEEFEYALHTGRTGVFDKKGQISGAAMSVLTKWTTRGQFDAISKEDNVRKLFELLRSQDPAFAALLDIYDKSGALTQKGNSIFDWDKATRDFIYNFPDKANLFLDSGQIQFAEGKKYQNASDYVDENSIEKVIDMLSEAYPDRNYDSYKGDEIASDFSLATGLDNIPYDGYPAILHEGEMVIPAKRANFIRALFGKPTVNYSNVPANRSTGYNSFVQSIPEYASGVDYITGDAVDTVFPIFAQRLSKAIQELIGYPIPMVSGYRDIETQSKLYNLNPKKVAKPGYSIHETGWAADIGMANSRDQFNFDLYPFNKLTNYQLSKYGLWKPFWPGFLKQEAWHTEGIETKGMGRGLTAVNKLIERYGIPGVKTSSITEDIEDYPGFLADFSSETTEDGIPIEYQHLIPYAYIPRIAETLRRVGYKKSTPSYGYGSYMPSVGVPAVKDNSELDKNIYKPLLEKYANLYSLPLNLLYGIMMTESSGNPNANRDNNRQYKGLMQVNQSKVDALGGGDIFDPETNIKTGANYLKHCYDRLGYWTTATAGYNQGPGLRAFTMIADLYEKGYGYNSPEVYDIFHNYLIGGRPAKMDIYVGRAYKFGGIEPVGAYLAEGGIVTSPTVAMIGEGKHDEAVIPLDHQQDYLGIQTMTINIIDALDIISDRICQRLDTLIYLRKQEGNSEKKIINTQRSARTEALTNFQYKY